MNIHEYQAKEILDRFGVPTPHAEVASTPAEAKEIASRIGGRVVVKAQVHAGGRGKVGGVKLVDSPEQAEEVAAGLIGSRLVTKQTGANGVPVEKVMIAETLDIKDELYLSIVIDGDIGAPVVMASTEGGMEIEEVAEATPEKIFRVAGDPLIGLTTYHARDIALALEVPAKSVRATTKLITDLYNVFVENDCSLVEINPLVITEDDQVVALDAKINLEDDALFRHPELAGLADPEINDAICIVITAGPDLELQVAGKGRIEKVCFCLEFGLNLAGSQCVDLVRGRVRRQFSALVINRGETLQFGVILAAVRRAGAGSTGNGRR